jgi:type IV secretion system protein VirB8
MRYQEPSPEEYIRIAEKVRSGEYFREARSMYDLSVNDPMAERYFYVAITFCALLTLCVAFYAMQMLYPLSRTVPFIYMVQDVVEDIPSIRPLRTSPMQKIDDVVLQFMAETYVSQYESYDINRLEYNYGGVQNASAPEVFARYQQLIDTNNPESPVMKYQRHSVRKIAVVSNRLLDVSPPALEVVFDASVESAEGVVRTRHRATLEYTYSGIEIDKQTGMVKPILFKVMRYTSRMIQDKI